ncbi:DUF4442 domain-containing protein [Kangiella sp. HZ709]|uniref:DUF4442 domain-containing protein n=1 Tax=Kangiella sp. HZ709 TaxID=2666328 RepID=UPI0012B06BAD|nr:DUF4442 domain-containing protein [Kangiella sp. HZ709]MRX27373.1 DUF4442 domain-containing protein [Kangiella sp. HZ709]
MTKPNRLVRAIAKTKKLPKFLQRPALNYALRKTVKLVGTAKVDAIKLTAEESIFKIENRTKVQNHIGSVHAAAMALLAETATGMVVGMHVPDDKIPVIKSMNINYVKRAVGALTAKAHLTQEQIDAILTTEKGEVTVAVTVTDEEGKEPIEAEMIWAWVPKRR